MKRPRLDKNGIPVIWWIGTSTRHQKYSPLVQFDWCWQISLENGLYPIAILRVPGHSRNYIFFQDAQKDLPAYRCLFDILDGKNGQPPQMLLTMARDRLGREALATQVEALCDKYHCRVWSGRTGKPVEGNIGQIYASGMELTFSRAENYHTQSRRKGAVLSRVKEKKLPYAKPEYGYKTVRDSRGKSVGVEIDPDKAETRQLIDELFIAGNSPITISKMLQSRFENGDLSCSPPAKDQWHANVVRRLLKSRFPSGEYNAHVSGEDISVIGNHPYLRTLEQQEAIDRQFERRKVGTQRGNIGVARNYGIAYCADCGAKMIRGHSRPTKINNGIDYSCGTYVYSLRTTQKVCSTHYTYESLITDAIVNFFQKPIDESLLAIQSRSPKDRSQEIFDAQNRLKTISKKKVDLIKLKLETGIAQDSFVQVLQELEDQESITMAEIRELERNQAKIPDTAQIKKWLEEMLTIENIKDWLENDDPNVIRTIFGGRLMVKCYQRKYKSTEPSPVVELIV